MKRFRMLALLFAPVLMALGFTAPAAHAAPPPPAQAHALSNDYTGYNVAVPSFTVNAEVDMAAGFASVLPENPVSSGGHTYYQYVLAHNTAYCLQADLNNRTIDLGDCSAGGGRQDFWFNGTYINNLGAQGLGAGCLWGGGGPGSYVDLEACADSGGFGWTEPDE